MRPATFMLVAAIAVASAAVPTGQDQYLGVARAAAAERSCGTVKTKRGDRFNVTATRKVPCKTARGIGRSFMNGDWSEHGGPAAAQTYYTNGKYPGWKCGTGTDGGGCRKNNSNVRRLTIQRAA